MARLILAAVGRMKVDPLKALVDDYLARARPLLKRLGYAGVEQREVPESRKASADLRREEEAQALLRAIGRDAALLVLDERGEMLTSLQFADLLRRSGRQGRDAVALVIGGPDGLSPSLREQAAAAIAFGRMTWPHRLARLMLAEQVYRAGTIAAGHPYHRD